MADMIRVSWKTSVPAVSVRFLSGWSLYNAGEIAGFTAEIAQSLVDAGVAIYVTPPVPDAPKEIALPAVPDPHDELAHLNLETKDTPEEDLKKNLKAPPKDKMIGGEQARTKKR